MGKRPNAWRWIEFFADNDNRLSMSRLTVFMSFWPATLLVMRLGSEMALGLYLGTYVGGYSASKVTDIFTKAAGKK